MDLIKAYYQQGAESLPQIRCPLILVSITYLHQNRTLCVNIPFFTKCLRVRFLIFFFIHGSFKSFFRIKVSQTLSSNLQKSKKLYSYKNSCSYKNFNGSALEMSVKSTEHREGNVPPPSQLARDYSKVLNVTHHHFNSRHSIPEIPVTYSMLVLDSLATIQIVTKTISPTTITPRLKNFSEIVALSWPKSLLPSCNTAGFNLN